MAILTRFVHTLDRTTTLFGKVFAWVGLVMVFGTLANVLLRYVYGLAPIALYEAVLYAFGMVLTACAGWTWLRDEHVRIDTVYSRFGPKGRAVINLGGIALLLGPMLWLVWTRGYPYVQRSWATLERSQDQSGIPAVFLLKTFILVFVVVMIVATVTVTIRAVAELLGRPIPALPNRQGE